MIQVVTLALDSSLTYIKIINIGIQSKNMHDTIYCPMKYHDNHKILKYCPALSTPPINSCIQTSPVDKNVMDNHLPFQVHEQNDFAKILLRTSPIICRTI